MQLIVGIVLARLLFPEQFGLIGMLMIFMNLRDNRTHLHMSGEGSLLEFTKEH